MDAEKNKYYINTSEYITCNGDNETIAQKGYGPKFNTPLCAVNISYNLYLHQYTKVYWSKDGEDFPPENYISHLWDAGSATEFSFDPTQNEWFLTQTYYNEKYVLLNDGLDTKYRIRKFYWNYPIIDER